MEIRFLGKTLDKIPPKQLALVLAILALMGALFWHLLEWGYSGNPFLWHETADDASYYQPAFHFWETGTWKDNLNDPSAYVQRPPLTGTLHLLARIFGEKNEPLIYFICALMLHVSSVYYWATYSLSHFSKRMTVLFGFFYSLSPLFLGFLSYRLSESIELPLCLLAWTSLSRKTTASIIELGSWTLVFWLFRPVLILFVVPLWIQQIIRIRNIDWRRTSLSLTVFFTLSVVTLGWEIRKVHYGFSFGEPHPIYHPKNESIFRPEHAALSDLFRNWEYQPERFHALAGSFWEGNIELGNRLLTEYNYQGHAGDFPIHQLQQLLYEYATLGKKFRSQPNSSSLMRSEQVFAEKISRISNHYEQGHLKQRWISTPLKSARLQLKKSQLNLRIFQETFRGSWWTECIRYGSLFFIWLGYGSLFFLAFRKTTLSWLAQGGLCYFLYLTEVQVMNEDRYFLPLALAGFLGLMFSVHSFKKNRSVLEQKQSN